MHYTYSRQTLSSCLAKEHCSATKNISVQYKDEKKDLYKLLYFIYILNNLMMIMIIISDYDDANEGAHAAAAALDAKFH